jgi:hypothetical protein
VLGDGVSGDAGLIGAGPAEALVFNRRSFGLLREVGARSLVVRMDSAKFRGQVSWPDGTGAFASPWISRVSAPSGHKFGHKFFDLVLGRRTYDMWNEGMTFHESPGSHARK